MSNTHSSPTPPVDPREPVSLIDINTRATGLQDGMALCLSGGGYRAMIFHLGALIRLNEVGLLAGLKRISSVSGGSITAARLGMQWRNLKFENGVAANLHELVIEPVRRLSEQTIDQWSILSGLLTPGVSISDKVTAAYQKHLFGNATLQDLPADHEGPRFVINATNVQSGALWRFSRPYMGDYKVGRVPNPTIPLATAVAASSAFPPILSPMVMKLSPQDFMPDSTAKLNGSEYREKVVLSDGGVYDNLGLETAWKRFKTLLVSDGGGQMQHEANPKRDWAQHAVRVTGIIDNQVRSLRKRQLISAFKDQQEPHDGTYWGIWSDLEQYPESPVNFPEDAAKKLAAVPTRLQKMRPELQDGLIKWGYAACAAAIASHVQRG